MIVSRTRKPELRTCAGCGKDHPTTLFNAQGFCVYCAAAKVLEQTPEKYAAKAQTDEQRALAEKRRLHLEIQSKKRRALKKVKEESERKQSAEQELSAAEAAKQELARRELARNHLLPFILRFNESYEAGWVHKDICDKLEWFSAAVAAKESPRLMIFMPPRHGKLLADSTPVLTVDGWKTHGELRIGDQVFHPSGRPVRVVALTEKASADWLVETTSGETIRCHENHEWTIYDRTDGEWKTVPTSWFVRQTKFGKQVKLTSGTRAKYQLPKVEALQFPEADPPMHPYVVGFQPTMDIPCELERKRPKRLVPQRRMAIKAVTYAPTGEQGHCIQVDSADGLYLVGRQLVPTHNSEIGSRSFPAWHLGRYPNHEFIGCSYGSDLANGFSRKVRDLVRDPAFAAVFPECSINKDSQSVENWLTTAGGGYAAAGVGGPITGRGAHCFPAGTPVITEFGQLPIESVQVGMRVFTCDISTGNMSYQPVVASASHATQHRLVEIITASGQRVRATPDHRFYVPTMGWIEAADLRPGDPVILASHRDSLRSLPQAGGAGSGRGAQGDQKGLPAHGLQHRLRGRDAAQGVSDLRREVRPDQAGAECEVLLERLHPQAEHDGAQSLPALHDNVHAAQPQDTVLQPVVRERGSLGADARGWELPLQRRAELRPLVRFDAATDHREGRWVRGLRDIAGRPYSPHRPRPDQQRGYQPDLFVPDTSHDPSQVCVDTVSMVTVDGDPGERVYDIQVEGTHCFFAGDILVHNCLVIDDPIKNREDAESAQKRDAVWDWYTSTAYTRLAPGGGVLLILTRWHDDDLAGRLLRKMAEGEGDEWVVVEYPAEAVTDELFRKAGEPLHPERYDGEALTRIKRAVGPRDWQALYQQNPTPDEGDYFNLNMFKWYGPQDIPPYEELNFYTAWDLAIGEKEQNDYSVGITVGVDKSDRTYVVDIQRGHWGTLELVDKMLEVYKVWRPAITGIEKGHIEMTLRPFLEKRIREERLTSFYIEELNPGRRDKVARARSIQGRMQQGLVYFRRHCNATAALQAEMMRFPNGVHDDQVDAMAWIGQILSLMVQPREVKAPPKKSWKDKLDRLAGVSGTGRRSHLSA